MSDNPTCIMCDQKGLYVVNGIFYCDDHYTEQLEIDELNKEPQKPQRCPVCGKIIVSPVPTLYTREVACSLRCAELFAEIHKADTALRRLRAEASDRKATQGLRAEMAKILELFVHSGHEYRTPNTYGELMQLKKDIARIIQGLDEDNW